ncbi:hypothetical protein KHQ89_05690 [Mycoplasmatota bacterium]|nr:hypothetical protein KHQ89_05690 [Mycoplasmatota bacterium]
MKKIAINFTGRRGGGAIVSLETTKAFLLKGYEVSAIISSDIDNLEEWRELELKKLVIINTYNSLLQFIFNTIFFSFRQKKIIINNLKDIGEIDFVYCPMGASWSYRINKIIDRKYYIVNHDPIPHSGENLLFKIYRLVFNTNKIYKKAKAIIVHTKNLLIILKKNIKMKTLYIFL